MNKGLSHEDAVQTARTLSKYPAFWVDHMLLHEIGIIPPSEEDDAWRSSRGSGGTELAASCS